MDFAAARLKMVESQLRTEDVTDFGVLLAMGEVPRERFVPERLRTLAYIDEDLLLTAPRAAPARYLMRPAAFARLIQLAEIRDADRILDVGCATGYSTAVLARLAGSVIGLESNESLAAEAKRTLGEFGSTDASVVTGALTNGHAPEGPYDVIIVEGAVDAVPEGLTAQLAEGGRLVAVLGHGRSASAMIYARAGREVSGRPAFNANLPPLTGFEKPKAFVF